MVEIARKKYSYNQETGVLLSRTRGVPILFNTSMKGKQYRPYQIAFLLMEGYIPAIIDHIDGDRSNNRWYNLREVNGYQSSANTRKKGVYQNPQGKWYWQLCFQSERLYKSGYATEAEAIEAHTRMCELLQKEYAVTISRKGISE